MGNDETGETPSFGAMLKKAGVLAVLNKFCGRNEHLEKIKMSTNHESGIKKKQCRSHHPSSLMAQDDDFVELIRRVRKGDEQASAELVHRYEPAIRIAVRARLTDPKLRRWLDSMDVCQSVLGNFFVRAANGQFELDRPEQLISLLATMSRNRVTNHALREQAARRDQRRVAAPTAASEAEHG